MTKPKHRSGYSDLYTRECERVLLTLFSGLGPYRGSLCLIGGLTPRYLVRKSPPDIAAHAGTGDVDIVVDLAILTNVESYATLEENLERLDFERAENSEGRKQSWRWQIKTNRNVTMIVEFLAYDEQRGGGKVMPLPSEGKMSALNIPHSSIVFDMFETQEIEGELLNDRGFTKQIIKYANIVAYSCLKILAFCDRAEGKDAHDLVYCIEHAPQGIDGIAAMFRHELVGKHAELVRKALNLMHRCFVTEGDREGYRKDGAIAVSDFEIAEDFDGAGEARILRRRRASDIITMLLDVIRRI